MDYPELIAEVTARTGDSAVATRAAMFLGMAEAALNKSLRLSENEAQTTVTTDAEGKADLPEDFASMRRVTLVGNSVPTIRDVQAVEFPVVTITTDRKWGYAIQGGVLVSSWTNADLTLYYYKRLPSLAIAGTNWLLESDPEIYLFAMMEQVFKAKFDTEKALACRTALDDLLMQRKRDDARQRFGKTPYRVSGMVI